VLKHATVRLVDTPGRFSVRTDHIGGQFEEHLARERIVLRME
jgi:hypothetical protein